jgi:hypothetical protein
MAVTIILVFFSVNEEPLDRFATLDKSVPNSWSENCQLFFTLDLPLDPVDEGDCLTWISPPETQMEH